MLQLPDDDGELASLLNLLLDHVEAMCADGQLLRTEPATPDVVRFRRWYFDEIARQADGHPPQPWSAARAL